MNDKELLELAAKAAGIEIEQRYEEPTNFKGLLRKSWKEWNNCAFWNPLTDDGDRYRLAKELGLTIDFTECTVWKRLSDHSLIQEYWGGDCGDEAHAIVRAAAEIGKVMS